MLNGVCEGEKERERERERRERGGSHLRKLKVAISTNLLTV